jgi:hypothetical protein
VAEHFSPPYESNCCLHGKVDARVETQTTLVRAESRVELHTVSTVDAKLAGIVLPDDTELNDTLGNGADLEGGAVLWMLLEEGAVLECAGELCS